MRASHKGPTPCSWYQTTISEGAKYRSNKTGVRGGGFGVSGDGVLAGDGGSSSEDAVREMTTGPSRAGESFLVGVLGSGRPSCFAGDGDVSSGASLPCGSEA